MPKAMEVLEDLNSASHKKNIKNKIGDNEDIIDSIKTLDIRDNADVSEQSRTLKEDKEEKVASISHNMHNNTELKLKHLSAEFNPNRRIVKNKKSRKRFITVDTARRSGKKDLRALVNFVITFGIHEPFAHLVGDGGRPGPCIQQINVLNYHTLEDLSHLIACEAEYQDTRGDISENPEFKITSLSMDKYTSSMFYFDNTFYVKGPEDYSQVIKEWASNRKMKLGEANTMLMSEMKVEDLQVRMGYPYVYVHQGNCEHLVIISDARLLTARDSLHSSDYPMLLKIKQHQMSYCATCAREVARWIVVDSDRMTQNPCYMCNGCFESYHYINHKKVGNFKAFRWNQKGLLF